MESPLISSWDKKANSAAWTIKPLNRFFLLSGQFKETTFKLGCDKKVCFFTKLLHYQAQNDNIPLLLSSQQPAQNPGNV